MKPDYEYSNGTITGKLWQSDALAMSDSLLNEYSSRVDLIYIDPPFCTGLQFKSGEQLAYSDCRDIEGFMVFFRHVLVNAKQLLKDTGSIYVHIDYRLSGRVRMLLDELFGEENFRNEIVWSYNSGGRAKKHFSRKHDTIFFYSKTKDYYFNIEAVGVPRGSIRRNNMKRGVDSEGSVYYSIRVGGKEYKYYENDLVYPTDVWTDIEHLHQRNKERTGYPTQKPLSLLMRIISVSTRDGDLVCDLFSGSGTTAVAATRLNRNWLAVDNSPVAVQTLIHRLEQK